MATILCVDDEPAVGVVLEQTLQRIGHEPWLAGGVEEAITVVTQNPIDLIISDYRMPNGTGLDLLARLDEEQVNVPVIMMTGYSSIEHAVESIKRGAIDYLTKPVQTATLEIAVRQALEVVELRKENDRFRREISSLKAARQIVGDSQSLRSVLDTIQTVAPTRATVLLHGESGTGKELFARALHDQSPRCDKPFVSVNCAAMLEGLVESGLFGHEKGAFTGATARSAGAFERAYQGTLLLDEISEMRLDLQAKLLRVIQEHEFERVGGQKPIKVDVRIVATTNCDLKHEVKEGRFRDDLYYRINVVPIRTPALREHKEDIPLLVRHFISRANAENGSQVEGVDSAALERLQRYHWPGNVRELANVVQRASILSHHPTLQTGSFDGLFGADAETSAESPGLNGTSRSGNFTIPAELFDLSELEWIGIQKALDATGGNRTRAAQLLGIGERTLRNKLKQRKKD